MIFKTWELWCDHFTVYAADHRSRCRSILTIDEGNKAEAIKIAKEQHWVFKADDKQYCPVHAFKHRMEKAR